MTYVYNFNEQFQTRLLTTVERRRLDDGPQGEGIEAPLYFDGKLSAKVDADTRGGSFSQPAGNQLKKASGARLLLSEPTPPDIKIGWFLPQKQASA